MVDDFASVIRQVAAFLNKKVNIISFQINTLCKYYCLVQLEDAAVEKLVDFLNIKKMRKNAMVRNQSTIS